MRRAFTLIEVLVALAIFALSAVVLGTAYLNVLNGYERARLAVQTDDDVKYARATLLAETDVEKAREGGKFEGAGGRQLRWTVTIDPTTVADLFHVIFECEITAPSQRGPELVHEEFQVLRPTWSVSADREALRSDARKRIEDLNTRRP